MPEIKCPWDICRHINLETGYCDCPDDVELEKEDIEIEDEQGGTELQQYLVCKSYDES